MRRFLISLAASLGTFGIVLPPSMAPQVWGLPPSALAGPAASNLAEIETLESRLTACFRAARLGLRDIPREAFDPPALALKLGHDPGKALAFLREKTSLVPYPGALRGARGVLMDGTGNALDRALLLAALLDDGKREIRLARAEMTESWIQRALLPGVKKPIAANAVAESSDTGALGVESFAEYPAREREALASERLDMQESLELIAERVSSQAPALAAALPPDGGQHGWSDAELTRILADHWWVRYRDKDGQWVDLDPASPEGAPAEPTAIFEPKAIPGELFHTVTIRVVVEQLKDGSLSRKTPFEHTLRVVDVHGQDVHLSCVPLNWPDDLQLVGELKATQERLKEAVAEQSEWLPVLTFGKNTVKQASFYDTGDVNKNPNLTTTSKKLARAQSALSDLGTSGRKGTLCGAWVEYVVETPGRLPQTQQRTLVDLIEPEARADARPPQVSMGPARRLERGFAVLGTIDLLLLGGDFNMEYLTDLSLRRILQNRRGALGVLDAARRNRPREINAQIAKFKPSPGGLFALALLRRNAHPSGRSLYAGETNVLSHWMRSGLDAEETPVVSGIFDIIANGLEVRPGAANDARLLRVRQGVVDTVAEAVLAGRLANGKVQNASHIYAASTSRNIAWRTVRDAGDPLLAALDVPARSRQAILRDLASGYTVMVPEDSSSDPAFSWWRIRDDGQTLGMLGEGEGAAVPAYLVMLGIVMTTLTTFLVATICLKTQAGVRCYVCAGLFGVASGLAVSFALASAITSLTAVTATQTISLASTLKVAALISATLMAACSAG